MTRKHFEALASIYNAELAVALSDETRNAVRGIILSSADVFMQANPRFSRSRFYLASGLTSTGNLF